MDVLPDYLSVIVRTASPRRLHLLDEALFSLCAQRWPKIQVVLTVQSPSQQFEAETRRLLERQPWSVETRLTYLPVAVDPRIDGRAVLATAGCQAARGEYLAFLDDDDVVYQFGYAMLIEVLKQNTRAVMACGCARLAYIKDLGDRYFVTRKTETPFGWGKSKFDLFTGNFINIHSYVVARARLAAEILYFDSKYVPLEDYEFLLRLASAGPFDLSKRCIPVCEYRIHDDNTVGLIDNHRIDSPVGKAQKLIDAAKLNLSMPMTRQEWDFLANLSHHQEASLQPTPPPYVRRRRLHRIADRIYARVDKWKTAFKRH